MSLEAPLIQTLRGFFVRVLTKRTAWLLTEVGTCLPSGSHTALYKPKLQAYNLSRKTGIRSSQHSVLGLLMSSKPPVEQTQNPVLTGQAP